MFPILYDANVTTIENNGIGVLSDCVSCTIKEVLNGEYTLEMVYPLGGLHSEEIERGKLIYARRNNKGDKQLFRISSIKIDLIGRNMEIYAPHISYDLENYPIPAPAPGTKYESAYGWLEYLQNFGFYGVTQPFTFTGDITASDTDYAERMERQNRTVRGLLLTDNDAIIDTYKPTIEFEFDNFEVKFLKARGSDSGLEVRYGKNLLTLESNEESGPVYYGNIPYYTYTVDDVPKFIYASAHKDTGYDDTDPLKRALTTIDFTEDVNDELGLQLDGEPTTTQRTQILTKLITLSNEWNRRNMIKRLVNERIGYASITFTYLDMENTGLYYWNGPKPKDVHADLGDYITLYFGDLVANREIVEVVYDVLKERFESLTVGEVRANLAKTIRQIAKS